MNLNVIYEDNHIIVCEKPMGILSQAGSMDKPDMLSLVKSYIKEKFNKPGNVFCGLVHRLDINVGGVMVFARTSKAASRLSETIRKHDFNKSYLAIVEGKMPIGMENTLEDKLEKDNTERKAIVTNSDKGKTATLNFKVLDNKIINQKSYSLLDIELITGRFHQIRAQLANYGHPLMGDTKYGNAKQDGDYFLGLYSYRIEFKHPVKDEIMKFQILPNYNNFSYFESTINNLKRREL